MLPEIVEQVKLLFGQHDGLAVEAGAIAGRLNAQLARRARAGACRAVRTVLFQVHADAGQQFLDGEGLGHVIVRAHVQTHHLVAYVILGGEHDDGHVAGLPQAAADFDTAQRRQHQVQNHQIGLPALAQPQPRAPVMRRLHLVPLMLQLQCHETGDLYLVLNDQNLAHNALLAPLF